MEEKSKVSNLVQRARDQLEGRFSVVSHSAAIDDICEAIMELERQIHELKAKLA